ncbi:MAG: pitrilysin family protein [Candidatus Magasanikbacteria bacterium]|nr:pitrilysin family protein [Candidatus Magasanikbacteria bacterium]
MHKFFNLNNGVTLITVPVAGTRATTVLAMFPVGSRYESKKLSGASHFLEHMLFKGTSKRPEAIDISRELEAAGAEYNAFTNKDYTGYYVKIAATKQELAFDTIADMIYNSKIEPAEVEKEKGAIVEELRMYKDNPTMAVDMLFDSVIFGDTPLGWDIGGTPDSVRAITRAELWGYYQEHYSPKNMVLSVAGKIDAKLKKYLNNFLAKPALAGAHTTEYYKKNFSKMVWPRKAPALEKRVAVEERKADQAHLILGFPGLPNTSPERYAVALLLNILGGGMSSRLFIEVREKRGLAYMVQAGSSTFRDVGVAYVQAGLDPARLKEALQVIKGELLRIAAEPVTAEELKNAKSCISGAMALSLENSRVQAEWFAKQFLFNAKIETPEQVIKKMMEVTTTDVLRVAKKIFVPEAMRVALIGQINKNKVLSYLT